MDERLALTIVTGFLGSGKTTLVRRFLATPAGTGTGVIVNEFGEVGLDHHLLVHAAEHVDVVDGGCLCCRRRTDVGRALHDLVGQARTERGVPFKRAIIETSGLADPAPIVATLARDPWLKTHVRLARVVAVVDAVAGLRNLETHEEARRQIALADLVVITKGDLRAAISLDVLGPAIRKIAPDVRLADAQNPEFDPARILGGELSPPRALDIEFAEQSTAHDGSVTSFVLPMAERIDWPAFTVWLSALLYTHGDRILRVKGLLATSSAREPLVIHGVQHVMHPPTHLSEAEGDQPGFLVFITKGIGKAEIAESLARFLAFAPAPGEARPV